MSVHRHLMIGGKTLIPPTYPAQAHQNDDTQSLATHSHLALYGWLEVLRYTRALRPVKVRVYLYSKTFLDPEASGVSSPCWIRLQEVAAFQVVQTHAAI